MEYIPQLLHAYFWAFITIISLGIFTNWNNDKNYPKEYEYNKKVNIMKYGIKSKLTYGEFILWTLFILSCKY